MRYAGLIFAWGILVAFLLGLVWIWFCLIRGTLQRRKDREAVRQRVREARAKILADGKIEGPKGKYKPKRWARTLSSTFAWKRRRLSAVPAANPRVPLLK